jgi:hypothetical protein
MPELTCQEWSPGFILLCCEFSKCTGVICRNRPYRSVQGSCLMSCFCVQDIFDMGLLPADTDFRMFSYAHQGRWPGVDVAFLLDAAAYHTDRDTTDRIRPGTLQV